jgi:type IV secretion system protein VirB3
MDTDLRHTNIQRVLVRENLISGGERELVLLTHLMCIGLIFVSMNLITLFTLVPLDIGLIIALRKMAKIDPYLSKVFMRSVSYQRYYPPRSRPFVRRLPFPRSPRRRDF